MTLEREKRLLVKIESLQLKFEEHTKYVAAFLSEMYAIMVDPLADGEIKVAETCAALLEAAKRDRNAEAERDSLRQRLQEAQETNRLLNVSLVELTRQLDEADAS